MCGTQLARTMPLMKKMVETAHRERVGGKCFRADAPGKEFMCRAFFSLSRFVRKGWGEGFRCLISRSAEYRECSAACDITRSAPPDKASCHRRRPTPSCEDALDTLARSAGEQISLASPRLLDASGRAKV